jgi:predicted alpha/beta hydrolase family esterase
MSTPIILLIPGLGNSGPHHWQTLWAQKYPKAQRVIQRDWDNPVLTEWVNTLDAHIAACQEPVVLVAHSLSCALVAQWVQTFGKQVYGALLVSPADVDSAAHTPAEAHVFSPMPLLPFTFPSIVVASSNDPYAELARAEHFAHCWGSRFVNAGEAGHINAASGHGEWLAGETLLAELLK